MRLNSLPGLTVGLMITSTIIMHFAGVANFWGRFIGLMGAFTCSLLIFVLLNRLRSDKIRRVLKGKVIALRLVATRPDGNAWDTLHLYVNRIITQNGGRVCVLDKRQAESLANRRGVRGNWDLSVFGDVACTSDDECCGTARFSTINGYLLSTLPLNGSPAEMAQKIIDRIVQILEQHPSIGEVQREPVPS